MSRDVREMWCYVVLDGYTERKSTAEISGKEKTQGIPNDTVITSSAERFRCLEVSFLPNFPE